MTVYIFGLFLIVSKATNNYTYQNGQHSKVKLSPLTLACDIKAKISLIRRPPPTCFNITLRSTSTGSCS